MYLTTCGCEQAVRSPSPMFQNTHSNTSAFSPKLLKQNFVARPVARAAILEQNEQISDQQQQQKPSQLISKPLIEQFESGQFVEDRALNSCLKTHQEWLEKKQSGEILACNQNEQVLKSAYDRCAYITSEYAKTFYLGTSLMSQEQAKAIWAVYVWCRRTDELVDGPNSSNITPTALNRWEDRLDAIFEGRPHDILDAALTDTVTKFPVDIQPFRDMIEGMRMDIAKARYNNFDELYGYCYRVAGTVGLMSTPVMGIEEKYSDQMYEIYKAALSLGTANQLTNILRDVGEDLRERNRIYVPLDELEQFGLCEEDLRKGLVNKSGKVDDRWVAFMKFQIERAREYFRIAEIGVYGLQEKARWPVWAALDIYRQILDYIEENGYDNFNKRAYVPKSKKILSLPNTYFKARDAPTKIIF
eukprot:TRINITY_DN4065_c0_g2_i1.p1 TRINITY_DN4065_c0_g2~~TRINITY_DN4065_c0_g2_i1.p1  ORF type:complete len:416 (-),score=78.01 TRINITY_DN4065_c0_g2_i1:1344-2591(-)